MANVTVMSGPNPTQEIISHFLDQYNQNRRSRDANAIQQQQVGIQQQEANQTGAYQNAQVDDAKKKFDLLKQQYNDTQLQSEADQYTRRIGAIKDAMQEHPEDANRQAALTAQAKALTDEVQARTDLMPYVHLNLVGSVLNNQRQTDINTNQFAANQTGAAAAGSTDPNAVNFTTKLATKEYMTKEGFAQQQAVDNKDKAGFESRATGATPDAEAKLKAQTQLTQEGMQQTGATKRQGMSDAAAMDREKLKYGNGAQDLPSMVDALTKRQASLDDFAKKGSQLRRDLINAMPKGTIAPSNEKERGELVGADNTASLMYDRIQKLRQLSSVVDNPTNRMAISGLLNASDGTFASFLKGTVRNHLDPQVLDYVQELRNLREDQFALRKYLGNSPVRSDKQVGIMLSQSVGTDAGSSADVHRMLDVFEPAVKKLVTGNQSAGAPFNPDAGITTTHDGLKWKKNPDGSMTQVP